MIRWNSNIAGFSRHHAFSGTVSNFPPPHSYITALPITFVDAGRVFLFTDAEWSDAFSFFFEITMRASAGQATARLFDLTDSVAVTGSTLQTISSTTVQLRSGALTLVDGHEYIAQYGTDEFSTGAAFDGHIVIV